MNSERKRGGSRPGAGRKPIESQDRLHPHSIYVTEAEWNHCNWQWTWEVSASEYIRRLIQKDIRERRQKWEKADADADATTPKPNH
jgi:hypothetical protein